MSKKKLDKNLLSEELKRFQSLNEFRFYEDDIVDKEDTTNLLLGMKEAEDEEEKPTSDDIFADDTEGGDAEAGDAPEEEPVDEPVDDAGGFGGDEPDFGAEGGFGDEPAMEEDPMDDAVELDVTELVKGSEEAKASADAANVKISQLMGMVDNLEDKLSGMAQISQKIDSLENEMEKRNPTEDEKLEMRSLDSYPYNLKLTDFWSNQNDKYDVMGTEEKEEYELNKKSVDDDYVETDVRGSFDIDDFTDEDI